MSSKRLPLTEIREKYKRMAIAGDVRGFEAVPFTKVITASLTGLNTLSAQTANTGSNLTYNGTSELDDVIYLEGLDGSFNKFVNGASSGYIYIRSDGVTPRDRFEGQLIIIQSKQTHKQANPTWTDIIGSPANIAAAFPEGVVGQWLPQLPTAGTDTFPMNRKALSSTVNRVFTGDGGATWTNQSRTLNSTTNSDTTTLNTSQVALYNYETQAHFTEDADNAKVLDLGGVFAGSRSQVHRVILGSTLIGKITTSAGWADTELEANLTGAYIRTRLLDSASLGRSPKHITIPLEQDGASAAFKALDYLSSENGVAKLSYAYKEMAYDSSADTPNEHTFVNQSSTFSYVAGNVYKLIHSNFVKLRDSVFVAEVSFTDTAANVDRYSLFQDGSLKSSNGSTKLVLHDGNGWGDNNQFEIANNQATQTDDNGNTVLYGTASFDTQYFVVEE